MFCKKMHKSFSNHLFSLQNFNKLAKSNDFLHFVSYFTVVSPYLFIDVCDIFNRKHEAQLNGSRCMALGHSFGLLLHGSIADAWLKVMRLEPVSMLAVVQGYGSRCTALGYAFGVFVYAGCCTVVLQ